MAPPDFGRSVYSISTKGTDYVHLITIGTRGFSDLPTALEKEKKTFYSLKVQNSKSGFVGFCTSFKIIHFFSKAKLF